MFAYTYPLTPPFEMGSGNGRVYLLLDASSMEVRYVGMTFQPAHTRLTAHRSERRTPGPGELFGSSEPLVVVVDRDNTRPDLAAREKRWIAWLRDSGARLLNA